MRTWEKRGSQGDQTTEEQRWDGADEVFTFVRGVPRPVDAQIEGKKKAATFQLTSLTNSSDDFRRLFDSSSVRVSC